MTTATALPGEVPAQTRRSRRGPARIQDRAAQAGIAAAVRVLAVICVLGPFLFAGILKIQSGII